MTLSARIHVLMLLLTPKFLISSAFFAFLFFFIASVLANIKNVISIYTSPYVFIVKLKLLGIVLFEGAVLSMGMIDVVFLSVIAVLFGINASLVMLKLSAIKKGGRISVVFGTGAFSIISAGCASCGLSAASLFGLGGAFAFLPFHGLEFYVLSLIVLLISLWINVGAYAKSCRL